MRQLVEIIYDPREKTLTKAWRVSTTETTGVMCVETGRMVYFDVPAWKTEKHVIQNPTPADLAYARTLL